ncbi:MAG: hypothetical protein E7J13_08440, partial [Streptococcus sp.]|nr:hypothetical protein [Streptococcus sp.]
RYKDKPLLTNTKLDLDGIYIKIKFGIRQEGLVFVPNMELDMEEDKVKVFIRETSRNRGRCLFPNCCWR